MPRGKETQKGELNQGTTTIINYLPVNQWGSVESRRCISTIQPEWNEAILEKSRKQLPGLEKIF